MKGLRIICSYEFLVNYIFWKDVMVVVKLKVVGVIILGKINILKLIGDF